MMKRCGFAIALLILSSCPAPAWVQAQQAATLENKALRVVALPGRTRGGGVRQVGCVRQAHGACGPGGRRGPQRADQQGRSREERVRTDCAARHRGRRRGGVLPRLERLRQDHPGKNGGKRRGPQRRALRRPARFLRRRRGLRPRASRHAGAHRARRELPPAVPRRRQHDRDVRLAGQAQAAQRAKDAAMPAPRKKRRARSRRSTWFSPARARPAGSPRRGSSSRTSRSTPASSSTKASGRTRTPPPCRPTSRRAIAWKRPFEARWRGDFIVAEGRRLADWPTRNQSFDFKSTSNVQKAEWWQGNPDPLDARFAAATSSKRARDWWKKAWRGGRRATRTPRRSGRSRWPASSSIRPYSRATRSACACTPTRPHATSRTSTSA